MVQRFKQFTVSDYNDLGQPVSFPVPDWQPPPRPPRQSLSGRFCRLEPLDAALHSAALYRAISADLSGETWTYMPYGPFADCASYQEWMRHYCAGDDPMFHAVIDLQDNQAIGVASYLNIHPNNGSIEVGHIHFSLRLQRSGAATEAMYLMMRNAFELGYRRYEWKCNALNQKSRAAALRLGLSYEGVFRQATVSKHRNRDSAWYAAVDSEWPRLKLAFERWLAPDNFDAEGRQRLSLSALTKEILVRSG